MFKLFGERIGEAIKIIKAFKNVYRFNCKGCIYEKFALCSRGHLVVNNNKYQNWRSKCYIKNTRF